MTARVLAIDTATEACSAAILVAGEVHEKFLIAPRRHSALILPMVEEVLAEAGVSLRQLDGLAFGRGPGSFTGVRIATAVIQGLARFRSALRAVEHLPGASLRHDLDARGTQRVSCTPPTTCRAFYVRAYHGSLSPRVPDMLTVRFWQPTGKATSTPQDPQPCRLLPPLPRLLFMRHHSQSSVVGKPIPVYK
jgi:tRNA threonylcarbamoyl adenosine modification protein YeaZ